MISPFLRRRWWFFQQRMISTISLSLCFPLLLFFLVRDPLSKIMTFDSNGIPFDKWLYPGMLILVGIVSLVPVLYRDLFEHRIHKKTILSMSLAPLSKFRLLSGFLISAIIESLFFVAVGIAIFSLLTSTFLVPMDYGILLGFVLVTNMVAGCFIITVVLLTSRIFSFFFILFLFFLYLLFGTGLIMPIELFPEKIDMILRHLPFGILLQGLQEAIFHGEFDWIRIVTLVVLTVPWSYANSELLRRKLNQ